MQYVGKPSVKPMGRFFTGDVGASGGKTVVPRKGVHALNT